MTVGLLYHHEEDKLYEDIYDLWDAVAFNWGFDFLIIIDLESKFSKRDRNTTFPTLEDAITTYPNHQYIYFMNESSVPEGLSFKYLHEFVHPRDNAIYVVGSDVGLDYGKLDMRNDSKIVSIMTARGNGADHQLRTVDAGLVAAYDRWKEVFG